MTRKVFAIMVLGFLSAGALADVVTFQQGTNGYTGNKDTMLKQDQPDTEFSQQPTISIDLVDPLENHGLIRFDDIIGNNPGQIPLGSQIISAKLTFWTTSSTSNNAVTMHRMLQPWKDTDTWNTRVNGLQADDIEARSAADFTFPLPIRSNEPFSADVTTSLKGWVEKNEMNYGWALLPHGSDGWDFGSAEYGTQNRRPILEVNYVPEPTSLVLLLVGGMALLRRRN